MPLRSPFSPRHSCGRCSPAQSVRFAGLRCQVIRTIDDLLLSQFSANHIVTNWVKLARERVPFQGLPARIAWLGHGERTELGLAVNRMVREGKLSAPVAFTRDHLDAGAMAHPNIMTENMRDGSDAIADWPLLN